MQEMRVKVGIFGVMKLQQNKKDGVCGTPSSKGGSAASQKLLAAMVEPSDQLAHY